MSKSLDKWLSAWMADTTKAKAPNNLIPDGSSLYHYGRHYQIAKVMEINGESVAVINNTSYSNTTTRVQSNLYPAFKPLVKKTIFLDLGYTGQYSYLPHIWDERHCSVVSNISSRHEDLFSATSLCPVAAKDLIRYGALDLFDRLVLHNKGLYKDSTLEAELKESCARNIETRARHILNSGFDVIDEPYKNLRSDAGKIISMYWDRSLVLKYMGSNKRSLSDAAMKIGGMDVR